MAVKHLKIKMNLHQNVSKSSRKNFIFILCLFVNLCAAMAYSLQAPFYPSEAEKKGVRATVYGLIMGCFELVSFLTCPIFGVIVRTVKPKSLLGWGMSINGIMVILFGLLDYCETEFKFVAFSFVLRIIEAAGATAAVFASYAFSASLFRDKMATKLATLDMFYGFGLIIGPLFGGVLYQIGGFYLPFMCNGIICGIVALLIFAFIPGATDNTDENEPPVEMKKLLKTPSILISILVGLILSLNLSFYLTTLEPYLREQYGVSTFAASFVIGFTGVGYAICTPICGKIVEHYIKPKWVVVISLLISIVANTLSGPLPFLPIPRILVISLVGVYLAYVSLSSAHLSAYLHAVEIAIRAGFPSNCEGLIIGLYFSASSLGSFIGPTLSGVLFDTVGFAMGTLALVIINIILLIVFSLCFIRDQQSDKKYEISS